MKGMRRSFVSLVFLFNILAGFTPIFAATFCSCDVNEDGRCDMRDLLMFGRQWGCTDCISASNLEGIFCCCDLNADGRCDMIDWLLFGKNWGKTHCLRKIMFIHHSCGSNWLANGNGNLGAALNANNYYVTESDYGWDAELTGTGLRPAPPVRFV